MTKEEFKEIRKSEGLSINELADILRVTGRTVRRWEKGERKIHDSIALMMENLEYLKRK